MLLCIMYAILSMEVRRCSEISHLVWNHCQNLTNVIFLVHQCDVKGCKENLLVDGNFYDNVQFCMANEIDMIPFMGRSERAA